MSASIEHCLAEVRKCHQLLGELRQVLEIVAGDFGALPLFPISGDLARLETIKLMTAKFYNLRVDQLECKSRQAHLVWGRHVAIFFAREFTSQTGATIGQHFGHRDHGTVFHAIQNVVDRCSVDAAAARELNLLGIELRKRFGLEKEKAAA